MNLPLATTDPGQGGQWSALNLPAQNYEIVSQTNLLKVDSIRNFMRSVSLLDRVSSSL